MIKDVLVDQEQIKRSHAISATHIEGCDCEDCTISQAVYDKDFENKTGVWRNQGRAGY